MAMTAEKTRNLLLKISGEKPRVRGYHIREHRDNWIPKLNKRYSLKVIDDTIRIMHEGKPSCSMMRELSRIQDMKKLVESERVDARVVRKDPIKDYGDAIHVEFLFFKNVQKKAGKRSFLSKTEIGEILYNIETGKFIFSSPEHEMLMVSYCGQWLSVVRRRASSVVRRASTFDVYTLETSFVTQF